MEISSSTVYNWVSNAMIKSTGATYQLLICSKMPVFKIDQAILIVLEQIIIELCNCYDA